MTVASIPLAARSFRTRLGNAVAIRLPARSATVQSRPCRRGVAERRRAESQRQPLTHRRVGLLGQIAPGDAEVELPRPDVDRNVLGPQEEELDLVGRIDDGQILGDRCGAGSPPPTGSRRPARSACPCWVRRRAACRSQLPVDVVEGQAARDHQHLRPVQQLADLARRGRRRSRARRPATPRRPPRGSSCRCRARRRRVRRPCRCRPAGCALVRSARRTARRRSSRVAIVSRRRRKVTAVTPGPQARRPSGLSESRRISPCMSSSDTPLVSITHRHTKRPDSTAHSP